MCIDILLFHLICEWLWALSLKLFGCTSRTRSISLLLSSPSSAMMSSIINLSRSCHTNQQTNPHTTCTYRDRFFMFTPFLNLTDCVYTTRKWSTISHFSPELIGFWFWVAWCSLFLISSQFNSTLLPFWKKSLGLIQDLMIRTSLVLLSLVVIVLHCVIVVESVSVVLQWPNVIILLEAFFEFPW